MILIASWAAKPGNGYDVVLVLFDFDGTLVDSRRRVIAAMAQAFAGHELRCPDEDTILATVGLKPEDMLDVLAPGLKRERRVAIAQDYRSHSIAHREANPDAERPFPQAQETLVHLKAKGHQLGIVTGKSAIGLGQNLDHLGWRALFDDLRPSDNAPGKPDPTLILRAMTAMGVTPPETIMIGDTTFDMVMANRAGVRAVGVGWGYHAPSSLVDEGAETVVKSFAALADHIAPS